MPYVNLSKYVLIIKILILLFSFLRFLINYRDPKLEYVSRTLVIQHNIMRIEN